MVKTKQYVVYAPRRTPRGVRGLKCSCCPLYTYHQRRAPHGARGLKCPVPALWAVYRTSRPAWGAWIEMTTQRRRSHTGTCLLYTSSRAPHGARGLKYTSLISVRETPRRAPHGARGLKSTIKIAVAPLPHGRAPHGARGLKYRWALVVIKERRRAPHGARGLKFERSIRFYNCG